jgi:hypothetical protein
MKRLLPFLLAVALAAPAFAQDAPKPLRILLITGGCCHDYAKQKDILKQGLEARANVVVEQMHTDDKTTKPPLALLGNADYAKGFDVVIHDECAAEIKDPAIVEAVVKPHRDGIPGVNLHCAMHCYRVGNPGKPQEPGTNESLWFDYLGLQSSGHGAQLPIEITYLEPNNPITKGFENWTTGKEELYNNIAIRPSATALARGKQGTGDKPGQNDTVIIWTNLYGEKKTRVFSTTLAHNNDTVSDARYLDLVTRGVLWAADKLNDDGTPKAGYGKN